MIGQISTHRFVESSAYWKVVYGHQFTQLRVLESAYKPVVQSVTHELFESNA